MITINGIDYEKGERYVYACVEGDVSSPSGALIEYRESDGTLFYQSDQVKGAPMSIFLSGENQYGPWRRELQPCPEAQGV